MLHELVPLLRDPILLFSLGILLAVARLVHLRCQLGLHKFNGPFLASFTDFWRYWKVRVNRDTVIALQLQDKYGDVVRIGPKALLFNDPQAIADIFGAAKDYTKSDFYPVAAGVSNGVAIPTLFSNVDELAHSRLRRAVSSAFNMSTLIQYELFVDDTVDVFIEQLDKRFEGKKGPDGLIDFPTWLQYYAFDQIGELSYSSRHGFLESGKDADGIIQFLTEYMEYVVKIGQMPILDKVFWKNPLLMWLSRLGLWNNTFPAVPFAKRAMNQRTQKSERLDAPPARQDLLSKFLQAKKEHPDFVTDKDVLAMALSMVFAGSETTGIALSSIFYFLLKNPRCLFKLRAEIDTLSKSSLPLSPRFPYNALQSLPYLSACIKESFRLHPPAAFSLERITPPTGVRICGRDIPGGVIVACNAWTLHRDKAVFGEDVDVFRPDRWLENDGIPLAKVKEMGRTLFHFGAGAHTCLGKNIALLEITKLVSSLFTVYDIELEDAGKEWKLDHTTFVKQSDFNVRVRRRGAKGNGNEHMA